MTTSLNTADRDLFTQLHWNNRATKDKVKFDYALNLCTKLHVHADESHIKRMFDKSDKDHSGYLDFDEFKYFVKLITERKEFKPIFKTYANEEGTMKLENFYKFLKNCQHEIVIMGSSDLQKIFDKFSEGKDYLDFDNFSNFLNSPYASCTKQIETDYSRPLNEYYISSSHNTYLLGRQINGVASIEGYVRALQRGSRCVEIDIWDGEDGPIVTHGRTLTNSIDFQTVVQTIRKYAFMTSPFPVILSLEIRCNPDNQVKVATILKDTLGDFLLTEPIMTNFITLPSPEELKHKILVKVKEPMILHVDPFSSDGTSDSISSSTSMSDDQGNNNLMSKITGKKTVIKICVELGSLGVYVAGVKFRNFSLQESKTPNHCFSFNNKKVQNMLEDDDKYKALMKHNRTFLVRIYPSAMRFKSNNFSPLLFWELGYV
ncbi:unnamed protein product [Ambrosiozyma monospora]|uniref:Unnamed protein product n=1 Tax=Ambrosiozyma monospora TaxID=43982 RepID=A0ACB5T811_AMBMO|nr:unnamed protein product [Ambrosiozyma monospora]